MKSHGVVDSTPDYASAAFLTRFQRFLQFDDGTPDYDAHRRLQEFIRQARPRDAASIEFQRTFIDYFEESKRQAPIHPSKLPYADFLGCEYWIKLTLYLKFHAGFTCRNCGSKPFPLGQGLQVHHKTYAHRGYEYPDHLDDLEVLCADCHHAKHFPPKEEVIEKLDPCIADYLLEYLESLEDGANWTVKAYEYLKRFELSVEDMNTVLGWVVGDATTAASADLEKPCESRP